MNLLRACNDYRGMTGRVDHTPDTARLFDELLVTHVQSGDRRAADRLAARWNPRLIRTATRLLRDEEQALTAVQECWISILRGIHKLRDPSRFAPWAFGILRLRCVDQIRRAQKQRDREAGSGAEIEVMANTEGAFDMRSAFDALPHDQRLAAQLFFVEGLSLAEIAEVQAVPVGTAKTRLFHARRKLKAALSGETP